MNGNMNEIKITHSILWGMVIFAILLVTETASSALKSHCDLQNCDEGVCINGSCISPDGLPAHKNSDGIVRETETSGKPPKNEIGKELCSSHLSCLTCKSKSECGWCDDGSKTGKGKCVPVEFHESTSSVDNFCPNDRWYLIDCPKCQCNGHSTCIGNTSKCIKPCSNFTRGDHCEECVSGYYGNSLNGATCLPCSCNNQGTECSVDSGKCICTTRGVIGDHCERCDVNSLYRGDPTKDSCFYDLAPDYQFTFNMSKKTDRHYKAINFSFSPQKPDADVYFQIVCSKSAKMKISMKMENDLRKQLLDNVDCHNDKNNSEITEYKFENKLNITVNSIYVNVYDLLPPVWVRINFTNSIPKFERKTFVIEL